MQWSSGPLGSTGSFGVELRSWWRGQGGHNRAGDVEFHGRSTYWRQRPGGIPALRGQSSGRVGLRNSKAALRSFCATRGRLRCGGEARPRRRGALLQRGGRREWYRGLGRR